MRLRIKDGDFIDHNMGYKDIKEPKSILHDIEYIHEDDKYFYYFEYDANGISQHRHRIRKEESIGPSNAVYANGTDVILFMEKASEFIRELVASKAGKL